MDVWRHPVPTKNFKSLVSARVAVLAATIKPLNSCGQHGVCFLTTKDHDMKKLNKPDKYMQYDEPDTPSAPKFYGSQHSYTCGLVKDTQGYVQAKQCYNPAAQQDMDAVVRKMYWGL